MARHLLRAGDRERALDLVKLCLSGATDLGLMAEHFDPRTGEQWGNFPQGFSHEEMALALLELFGQPAF
jgi:GH15 family glucan-1,4-alpha-glucosidase